MANLNNAELNTEELNRVAGGMPFYGMGCSLNRNQLIGAIDGAVSTIPVVGPVLSGLVGAVGRIICS